MILYFQVFVMRALTGLCAGCVTLPPENTNVASTAKTLHIQVDKVAPSVIEAQAFTKGTPMTFRTNGAMVLTNITQQLNYYWLADYDSSAGQPVYHYSVQSCAFAEDSCTVDFCAVDPLADNQHHLRLVVSDGRLKTNALTPWDFPAGTAFDSIEWAVKIKGACQ